MSPAPALLEAIRERSGHFCAPICPAPGQLGRRSDITHISRSLSENFVDKLDWNRKWMRLGICLSSYCAGSPGVGEPLVTKTAGAQDEPTP
jgi:hypothetical protein